MGIRQDHRQRLPDYPPPSSEPFALRDLSQPASFRHKTLDTAFGPISISRLIRRDWLKYYFFLLLIAILVAVVTIYHHQIILALHPWARSLKDLRVGSVRIGWLIPVLVLLVISFPPLFGHEIVIILCGLVWGLWFGFLIASAGTLLGELANYFAFKYACSHRAQKLEKTNLNYACMSAVVRQGGFGIAFLARLSAIPGHLVTPVFATTGMSLGVFTAATVLSMPKQLSGVYLGTLFNIEEPGQPKSTSSKLVQYTVLALSFIVTVVAAVYLYRQMAKVRPQLEAQWQAAETPYEPGPEFRGTTPPPLPSKSRPGEELVSQGLEFPYPLTCHESQLETRKHVHSNSSSSVLIEEEVPLRPMESRLGLIP